MAYAQRTYTPSSSTTTFALTTSGGDPIGYIQESDISVKVNGTTYTKAASGTNTYQISGSSTVEQPSGGNVVLNAGVTGTVILQRTTAIQDATVVYTAGSTLTSTDLNNADNQIRFGLQEFSDDYAALFTGTGDLTGLGAFLGSGDTWTSDNAKAATTGAIDARVDAKTTAKVKDDIIATAPVSIADDSPSAGKITISVDAELTELATMSTGTAQALADLTGTEVQILDDATVTTAELNYVDGVTSNIQTQLNNKQPLDGELTTLAGMQSDTASILAGGTALDATLSEINSVCENKASQTTITNDDLKIPTSGAVVDYVAGAVTAVGGLIAIANEVSFPATASMPDSGVVVSISDAGGLVITGAGASTSGRTTDGTPATVTINQFPSSLYNETLTAGIGLQVLSTGSSNTYNYHKILATEADVKALSDDINDFNARYRHGAPDPTTDEDDGDLFYNTSDNKMKVYDGSAWVDIVAPGDFKYLFLCPKNGGTGAPTFNGSEKEFDLRETSNSGAVADITNAAQLMVSINGVIQKPNAGTNESGLDGFVVADANTIKFCGAPASGDEIFIIQSGTAVSLNVPASNTVSEEKLKISNAGTNGQYLQKQSGNTGGLTWETVIPTTTRGDIIYRGASADQRLAKGTSGQYLKIGANDPEWADIVSTTADGVMWENNLTISNNYTIAATKGAHSVGPITNNATVTVNGRWVIS